MNEENRESAIEAASLKESVSVLDLVFVVDETGSMGPFLSAVKAQIKQIAESVIFLNHQHSSSHSQTNFSLIGFRDHCDSWSQKVHVSLTSDISLLVSAVSEMSPEGGGDYPEAVVDGLKQLCLLNWSQSPHSKRIAILFGDAPPHGIGYLHDDYPNGCLCGLDFKEQCLSLLEMSIVVHTIDLGLQGQVSKSAFEFISKTTGGKMLQLEDPKNISAFVLGLTNREFDMIRLKVDVFKMIDQHYEELLASFPDEFEAIRASQLVLWLENAGLLKSRFKSIDNIPEDARKEDIEHIISSSPFSPQNPDVQNKLKKLFPRLSSKQPSNVAIASLSAKATGENLPLVSVSVKSKIKGFIAQVEITQIFENNKEIPIEASYKFPVDSTISAVCGLAIEIDSKIITAKCMSKQRATAVYDDAIASGKGAYLMEQTIETADIFEMFVGNLPPGKKARICISLVTQIELIPGFTSDTKFFVPLTIAPRFCPKISDNDDQTKQEIETKQIESLPISIEVTVEKSDISTKSITLISPTHSIDQNTNFQDGEFSSVTMKVKSESSFLDRDFILQIHEDYISNTHPMIIEEDLSNTEHPIAACAFFRLISLPSSPIFAEDFNKTILWFAIDCSGSMNLNKSISAAKEALSSFINQIHTKYSGIKFNIILFGSSQKIIFQNDFAVSSDESSILKSFQLCQTIQADMGGSELLSTLQEIVSFTSKHSSVGTISSVILITDGLVFFSNHFKTKVSQMYQSLKVFPIACNNLNGSSLIKGIADSSFGFPELLLQSDNGLSEEIAMSVSRQIERAIFPITSASVVWTFENERTDQTNLLLSPNNTNLPINAFNGTVFPVTCLVPPLYGKIIRVTFKGSYRGVPFELIAKPQPKNAAGKIIHIKSALSLIRQLEKANSSNNTSENETQIVKLSATYCIVSKFTSFVAVEERNGTTIGSSMEKVVIPSISPASPSSSIKLSEDLTSITTKPTNPSSFRSPATSSFSYSATAASTSNILKTVTGCIYWRGEGIKYKKNELFFDVIEKLSFLYNSSGELLSTEVAGQIVCKCQLSGFPEVSIGINERFLRMLQEECVHQGSILFHQCVRMHGIKQGRISLVPPDGEFEICKYNSYIEGMKIPFILHHSIQSKGNQVHYQLTIEKAIKDLFPSSVKIEIPVPNNSSKFNIKNAIGKAKYVAEKSAIVWKITNFGDKSGVAILSAVVDVLGQHQQSWKSSPIMIHFDIPNFTATGSKIKFVKVIEKSHYESKVWYREITTSGNCEYRV